MGMTKIIKYHQTYQSVKHHHKLKPQKLTNNRLCNGTEGCLQSQDHLMYSLESALQMSELIQP